MYLSWIFAFFVLAMIVCSVNGWSILGTGRKMGKLAGMTDAEMITVYNYYHDKSCIGQSTVSKQGMYDVCGCSNDTCQWLIQKRACPLACLSKEYDVNKATEEDSVATVYYNIEHLKLREIDEIDGTITLRMKISALWEDNRIKAKFKGSEKRIQLLPIVDPNSASIWNPTKSTSYEGLKEKKIMRKSSELALTKGGEITNNLDLGFNANSTVVNATVDIQMTLFCDFELSSYPLDVQTCPFRMYSEDVEQILLNPHSNSHSTKSFDDSFDICFSFVEESDGNDETVGFDIQLKRQISPFIFKYYGPCIAVVILSFISFIVPLTAIPGRLSLLVTLFLTLTNIFMTHLVGIINVYICSVPGSY